MRRLIMGVVLGLAVLTPLQAQVLTDLAGRQVQVPERVERIVLGEGRLLPVLAVLEGEQLLQRLVGMPADLALVDPGSARQYQQAFPALAAVPRIGQGSADSFSLEQVLTLRPDLAIFSLSGHGPGRAGVPARPAKGRRHPRPRSHLRRPLARGAPA